MAPPEGSKIQKQTLKTCSNNQKHIRHPPRNLRSLGPGRPAGIPGPEVPHLNRNESPGRRGPARTPRSRSPETPRARCPRPPARAAAPEPRPHESRGTANALRPRDRHPRRSTGQPGRASPAEAVPPCPAQGGPGRPWGKASPQDPGLGDHESRPRPGPTSQEALKPCPPSHPNPGRAARVRGDNPRAWPNSTSKSKKEFVFKVLLLKF